MHRSTGILFMIVGVVGIVFNLMLVPTIWVGRALAIEQIASVADQVREPIQQVQDATGTVHARLDSVQSALGDISSQARAGNGPIEQAVATRLLAIFDQTVGSRYDQLTAAYTQLRERFTTAVQVLATIQRVVPGVSLPSLPVDDLTAIDTQLQAMNGAIQQMRSDLAAGSVPGVDRIQLLDAGLQQTTNLLQNATGRVEDIQARAQQAQAQVDQVQLSIENMLTAMCIALTLLAVYSALLHVALFAYGRTLSRSDSSVQTHLPEPAATPHLHEPGIHLPQPGS